MVDMEEHELQTLNGKSLSYEEQEDDGFGSLFIKGCLTMGGCFETLLCAPFVFCGSEAIRVEVPEGYRAAILRFGKLKKIVGPGTYYRNPCSEVFRLACVQIITLDVPKQQVMTSDNVTITINAVIYYQIVDVRKALFHVTNCDQATSNFAQSTLRTVIGENSLEKLFSDRAEVNDKLTAIIDKETDAWGIKVTNVEIKDIIIPQEMQRVLAAVAEAERDGQAKVIAAKAELKASNTLAEAADVIATNPITLQLRYFQTLSEISAEKNSTIIVPSEAFSMFTNTPRGTGIMEGMDLQSILNLRKQIKEQSEQRMKEEESMSKKIA